MKIKLEAAWGGFGSGAAHKHTLGRAGLLKLQPSGWEEAWMRTADEDTSS